jgi:hypothetical protein
MEEAAMPICPVDHRCNGEFHIFFNHLSTVLNHTEFGRTDIAGLYDM